MCGCRGWKSSLFGIGVSICVSAWSVQASVMSAQGLQAGGAISVCVYPLERACVSARVFVCVSGGSCQHV